jgi:hypothetical protein
MGKKDLLASQTREQSPGHWRTWNIGAYVRMPTGWGYGSFLRGKKSTLYCYCRNLMSRVFPQQAKADGFTARHSTTPIVERLRTRPRLAATFLWLQCVERVQAHRETALHAPQPGVPGKPGFGLLGWKPGKRGLVAEPEQWRSSSFRFYAYGETGAVRINDCDVRKMTVRAV